MSLGRRQADKKPPPDGPTAAQEQLGLNACEPDLGAGPIAIDAPQKTPATMAPMNANETHTAAMFSREAKSSFGIRPIQHLPV